MNIDNLSTQAKRKLLLKVSEHIRGYAESPYQEEVDSELQVVVDYYLNPLSAEDYFGTEGWEHFFEMD